MRNLAREADFGMKSRESDTVLRETLGKKLDGNKLAELQIFGAIHLAHAAAAGHGHDAISFGNDVAGGKTTATDWV
jgi:hypothetical protein